MSEQSQTRRDIEARIVTKAWKDEAYKQELLANPKAIFEQEFGVELPAEISVQVLEENSTTLNFVLPMRPETSGYELSETELEAVAGGGSPVGRISVAATVSVSALLVSVGGKIAEIAKQE